MSDIATPTKSDMLSPRSALAECNRANIMSLVPNDGKSLTRKSLLLQERPSFSSAKENDNSILDSELDAFDDDSIISFKPLPLNALLCDDSFTPQAQDQIQNLPVSLVSKITDKHVQSNFTSASETAVEESVDSVKSFLDPGITPLSKTVTLGLNCHLLMDDGDLFDIKAPFSAATDDSFFSLEHPQQDKSINEAEFSQAPVIVSAEDSLIKNLSLHCADKISMSDCKPDSGSTLCQLSNSPIKDEKKCVLESDFLSFKPESQTQLNNLPLNGDRASVRDCEFDPFKPKSQLTNSPTKSTEDPTGTIKPCEPDNHVDVPPAEQLTCSGHTDSSATEFVEEPALVNAVKFKIASHPSLISDALVDQDLPEQFNKTADTNASLSHDLPKSPAKGLISETFDCFKPKTQIPNSPSGNKMCEEIVPVEQMADHFISSVQCDNPGEPDLFKTKSQLPELATDETYGGLDIFKANLQIQNSPAKDESPDDFDPFKIKPRKQFLNSPLKDKNQREVDALKPSSPLNSPINKDISGEMVLLSTEMQLTQSPPTKLGEINPFEPVTQLPTSLLTEENESQTHPFMSKTELSTSPTKTLLLNSPTQENQREINPFKAGAKLLMSPVKGEVSAELHVVAVKPNNMISFQDRPAKDDNNIESDPFKSKSQLFNSPAKDSNASEMQSKNQLPDLTLTGSQPAIYSSPADNTVVKEVKTQFQSAAAMEYAMEAVPSKPESLSAESANKAVKNQDVAVGLEMQSQNLPDKKAGACKTIHNDLEINPFKSKVCIPNSPTRLQDEDFDPFQPRVKVVSSPSKQKVKVCKDIRESSETFAGKQNTPAKAINPSVPISSRSEEQSFCAVSKAPNGINLLEEFGARPQLSSNLMFLASGEDLGISDNEFISGEQVFNDPSAWDLLEQFGSKDTREVDLRKCSLYVKFDPLVKPSLPKTPEKMKAPSHAAPKRAATRAVDHLHTSQLNASLMNATTEESICLMGTPPRVSRRRSILTQRRLNTSVAPTITEEEQVQPMDLLFSLGMETGTAAHDMFLNDPEKQASSATLIEVEEVAVYTESEWQRLQQMLAMQYKGEILAKERQYAAQLEAGNARITDLEAQIKSVAEEQKELTSKAGMMKSVVVEYEKTLEMVIASKEKHMEEANVKVEAMQKERDQAFQDVAALENSFSELHRRYEKMKQVLEGFQKNEEILKKTVKTWQDKMKATEENLLKMKTKAEEKIAEVVGSMEQKEAELRRQEAELKKLRLQLQSQETTLEQKIRENKELTEFCESLINQVGGGKK